MTWEIWAIVVAIGLTASAVRALGRRARARTLRDHPLTPQVTAVALGTPGEGGLGVWLPAGEALPTQHRRILRTPSRARELVVSLHTDEPRLEALAELRIGPILHGERPTRLVELVVRISGSGRLGFAAREKTSGRRLPVQIDRPGLSASQARRPLQVPTRDGPPGTGTEGDRLADISWRSVPRR